MKSLFEVRRGSIQTAWIVLALWFVIMLMYGNVFDNNHYFPNICLLLFVFVVNCMAHDIIESGNINFYGILAGIAASILASFGYVYAMFDHEYWTAVINYGGSAASDYRFESGDVFASEQFSSLIIPMILVVIICVVLAKFVPKKFKIATYAVIAVLMALLFRIKLETVLIFCVLFAVFSMLSGLFFILCERMENTEKKLFIPVCFTLIATIVMFTVDQKYMADEFFMFVMILLAWFGSIFVIFGKVCGFKMITIPCVVMLFAFLLTNNKYDPSTFLIPMIVCLIGGGIAVVSFLKKDGNTDDVEKSTIEGKE